MAAGTSFLAPTVCLLLYSSSCVCKSVSSDQYSDNDELPTFRFASHFSDHMILQRKGISKDLPPVIWGFGEVAQTVKLTLGSVTKSSVVVLGPKGENVWKIMLDSQPAGGPYTIVATSVVNKTAVNITLNDVLFGDVWLCGGQSNMQFTVSQSFKKEEEIAVSTKYPNIRLFTTQRYQSSTPMTEIPKEYIMQPWTVASPDSVGGNDWQYFSAVCWMFGRKLYDKFKVPIGLISSNYGGTPVEAWSSPDALRKCSIPPEENESDERNTIEEYFPENPNGPIGHSVLWNAMIFPFINSTIKGAIWYQGESNAGSPDTYHCTFPAMVADWRAKWYEGTGKATAPLFPFGFVQLAPTGDNTSYVGGFPVIRWAQTANEGHTPNDKLPNTFFAVAMDLPDLKSPYTSIHPRDKTDVANRLYLGALNIAYGVNLHWQGPLIYDGRSVLHKLLPTLWGLQVYYDRNTIGAGITYRSLDGFEVLISNGTAASEKWLPVKIAAANVDHVILLIGISGPTEIKTYRYEWRTYPCQFMKCAIYTKDTGLPGPPWLYYGQIHVVEKSKYTIRDGQLVEKEL